MPEAYIRGNTIKYLRVPDEVIDKVRDDSYNRAGNRALHRSSCTAAAAHQQLRKSRAYNLVLVHTISMHEANADT